PDPDLGLDQVRLLAASLPDHTELITTLTERPVVGQRLAYLLGSSRVLGRYLDRIPEFVNQLDDDDAITDLRPRDELEHRLRRRPPDRPCRRPGSARDGGRGPNDGGPDRGGRHDGFRGDVARRWRPRVCCDRGGTLGRTGVVIRFGPRRPLRLRRPSRRRHR